MYAYLRFESPDQGVRHELADLDDMPQCGDTLVAQSGTALVVTDIISANSGRSVRGNYSGAVEIYCTPAPMPETVTRTSILSNLTLRYRGE